MEMTAGNVKLYYEQMGNAGRKILLLHGWGCSTEHFALLGRELSRDYRVTMVDFPGHGKSGRPPEPWGVPEYAACIREMMLRLGLPPCAIIAHSFGVHPQSDLTTTGSTEFCVVLLADAGEIFPQPVGTILTDINFAFRFQDISDCCKSRKIFYFWFHNKFRSFHFFIHRWCNSEFSGEGAGES